MIPRLYEKNEEEFTTYGICPLIDAIECTVTEERNGEYILEMTYARSGRFAEELTAERVILAYPHDNAEKPQPFRIATLEYDIDGNIEVYAEHISNQLNSCIIAPVSKNTRYPQTAMRNIKRDALLSASCPFAFYSDIGTASSTVYTISTDIPRSMKDILIGTEGSILDIWNGEYEWDMWDVHLWSARGSNNGVRITYGKNLTGLKYDIDMSNVVTGVVAYYVNGETYVQSDYQSVTHPYGYSRDVSINASSEFKTTPTKAQLNTFAQKYLNKHKKQVSISVEVEFVPLWQTEEYKDYYGFEHVQLCDTVEVIYPPLNLSLTAKVVKTVYNVLADKYDKIVINTVKQNIVDTIYALMKQR